MLLVLDSRIFYFSWCVFFKLPISGTNLGPAEHVFWLPSADAMICITRVVLIMAIVGGIGHLVLSPDDVLAGLALVLCCVGLAGTFWWR